MEYGYFERRLKSKDAELDTLRAEIKEWKSASRSQGDIIMEMQGHMENLRSENEVLQKKYEALIIAIGMINGIAKEALK